MSSGNYEGNAGRCRRWGALGGGDPRSRWRSHAELRRSNCYHGTVRVGKSAAAQAATISAGVELIPLGQKQRWFLDVEPGVYRERVWINVSIGPLTMRGLSATEDGVLLIYHCCPGGDGTPGCSNPGVDKTCAPQHANATWMGRDVETLLVEASDFVLLNMSVANDACGYDARRAGQSEAVSLLADRIAVRHSRIYGAQDTLYTGGGHLRSFFHSTFINGSCDSIYGYSTSVFDSCTITVVDHVTAHGGWCCGGSRCPDTDPRDRPNQTSCGIDGRAADGSYPYYLFINSSLMKPGAQEFDHKTSAPETELGRGWGTNAHVIYKDSYLDSHIAPHGWGCIMHATKMECSACARFGSACANTSECYCQNTTFAEYRSRGPGAAPDKRVAWSRQLTEHQAAAYTAQAALRGWAPPIGGVIPSGSGAALRAGTQVTQ